MEQLVEILTTISQQMQGELELRKQWNEKLKPLLDYGLNKIQEEIEKQDDWEKEEEKEKAARKIEEEKYEKERQIEKAKYDHAEAKRSVFALLSYANQEKVDKAIAQKYKNRIEKIKKLYFKEQERELNRALKLLGL